MTDRDQNKSTGTVRRNAQKSVSTSSDGVRHRELELETQCIKLEKQILELQNSLTDLHSTKRRLEKQVGEKADELLQKNQQYQHYQNELINFAKHTVRRLENERRKISRELHDNVAQGLATIKLFLENKLALMGEEEGSSSFSIEFILDITRDNLNEIRRIINYLRPKMLDDIGLLATIQRHWQEFQDRMSSGFRFFYHLFSILIIILILLFACPSWQPPFKVFFSFPVLDGVPKATIIGDR